MNNNRKVEYSEWEQEGIKRFGENRLEWRFKCPSCGYVSAAGDWVSLNAKNSIATSCIGRFTSPPSTNSIGSKKQGEPCNYAGFGLFKLNPVTVLNVPLIERNEKDEPIETEGELSIFEWAD